MREGNRKKAVLMGVDLGTTGIKAGLVDTGGRVISTVTVEYATEVPMPGWAEQDPEEWWRAFREASGKLASVADREGLHLAGIGLSGQMHGSVFLDSEEAVVRPCILWCDQRTALECARITREVGSENLLDWVSNPALTGFTAPKVLWLRENEPSEYERVSTLLLPKDYINLKLTGKRSTDVSDASGTLLFDVRERSWSKPMLRALDIPEGWMPEVFESCQAIGSVSDHAAGLTGLPPGLPVAAGGADNSCSALGMNAIDPGDISVSIGSSGTVLAPTAEPLADPRMRLHSFCSSVPGYWYLMGVMLSAGLSLRWFKDVLGEPEVSEAEKRGIDPYRALDETAEGAPPGCDGLLFLPYLCGERTPHADPYAKGAIIGLDLAKRRSHLVRSIMEGVAFGLNDSMALMKDLGVPLRRVKAGGGGSRSQLWLRIQADIFGAPVEVAAESDSAMLGAALLAGVAAGEFSSVEEACSRLPGPRQRLEPNPANRRVYADACRRYRALYPALKPLFAEIEKGRD